MPQIHRHTEKMIMPIHEKHFWHMFLSLQMVFHFVAAATVFTALEIISILATSLLIIKTRYLNCFTTLSFSLQTFILLENSFLSIISSRFFIRLTSSSTVPARPSILSAAKVCDIVDCPVILQGGYSWCIQGTC